MSDKTPDWNAIAEGSALTALEVKAENFAQSVPDLTDSLKTLARDIRAALEGAADE
ncbi:hypothetical protein [Thioalkalivibrio thiocyanodenitrificans]|uniref:hypothetical protein n=1 Tax=Thioalkalivibrio thiocyanodenitrificans TaxID=243063 RepID=UPI000361A1C5|nr:hypothetical protein [Thioalkalivibrio thiocyanodenitrificans]